MGSQRLQICKYGSCTASVLVLGQDMGSVRPSSRPESALLKGGPVSWQFLLQWQNLGRGSRSILSPSGPSWVTVLPPNNGNFGSHGSGVNIRFHRYKQLGSVQEAVRGPPLAHLAPCSPHPVHHGSRTEVKLGYRTERGGGATPVRLSVPGLALRCKCKSPVLPPAHPPVDVTGVSAQ